MATWQDNLEPWEVKILQEKKFDTVAAAATVWQRKRMAKQLIMAKEARRLRRQGKVMECECRRMECEMQCRAYLGVECNRQSGQRVPVIIGIMEVDEERLCLQPRKGGRNENDYTYPPWALGS